MLAALLGACADETTAPVGESGRVFVIQVVAEQFRVRIDDSVVVAQARALLASGQATTMNGEIARGHGGFNNGYSWHLRSATVEFMDATIEVCDGLPSFVEEHVDYFVDTVQHYCPWGVLVISEEPSQ